MTSDEENHWTVVGLAMVKVIAPALRDTVKQGMALHYSNLDASLPCNLKALTLTDVSKTSSFKNLTFGNINKNSKIHGKDKKNTTTMFLLMWTSRNCTFLTTLQNSQHLMSPLT